MNLNHEKSFFAGQAEIIARLSGLLIIVLFFVIYTATANQINLDWTGVTKGLGLFWFLYEITSLTFYQLFQYFQKSGEKVTRFEPIESFGDGKNDNQKLANQTSTNDTTQSTSTGSNEN